MLPLHQEHFALMQGFQSPGILVSEFALVGLWTAATLLA